MNHNANTGLIHFSGLLDWL